MPCKNDEHDMRPGVITEPDGTKTDIWFCDCGHWVEHKAMSTGEFPAWKASWELPKKDV